LAREKKLCITGRYFQSALRNSRTFMLKMTDKLHVMQPDPGCHRETPPDGGPIPDTAER